MTDTTNIPTFDRISNGWPDVLANLKSLLEFGSVPFAPVSDQPAVATS